MAKHATLSPSDAEAWCACPGKLALVASLPASDRDVPNFHSDWGTACHDILADCLEENRSPQTHLGREVVVPHEHHPEYRHTITQEDVNNINIAWQYVQTRLGEYGPGTVLMVEERMECGANFHTEELDLDTLEPKPVPLMDSRGHKPLFADACWGTADVVMIGGGYLEVIDYKNGTGFVDEHENKQMLLYALGALRHIPREQRPQRCRLTIIQPRAIQPGVEPVRTWEFPSGGDNRPFDDRLMDWAVFFGQKALAAQAPDAPRVPGDKQCKWCEAKAECPEYLQSSLGVLVSPPSAPAAAGAPVEAAPGAQMPTGLMEAMGQPVSDLDSTHLLEIWNAADMIRATLKAVEEKLLRDMLAGVQYPNLKLVRGRSSRKWTVSDEELIKKLGNVNRMDEKGKSGGGKLKKEEYTEVKVISPAQAEKRLKPLLTPRVWKNLSDLIERKDGAPTVAHETDSRPSLRLDGAEAFADMEAAPAPEAETEAALPDFLN